MKRTSQTHRGADLQNLLFPSTATRIGIWNVRTLYETGKSAQATREMDRYGLDILGLSEVRWTGDGEQILASGHVLLYSGLPKEDNVHMTHSPISIIVYQCHFKCHFISKNIKI